MNITQVKWNDREPSFEEVKGKLMLFTWNKEKIPGVIRVETKTYFDEYDWSGVSFSILSDEPVYCEWTKDEDAVYHTKCGHQFYFDDSSAIEENHHVWCQYCGSVIHIVDELKPLPLDEVMPKIIDHYNSESFSVEYEKDGWKYSTPMLESTEAAITAWNSLVKKLTGEK